MHLTNTYYAKEQPTILKFWYEFAKYSFWNIYVQVRGKIFAIALDFLSYKMNSIPADK